MKSFVVIVGLIGLAASAAHAQTSVPGTVGQRAQGATAGPATGAAGAKPSAPGPKAGPPAPAVSTPASASPCALTTKIGEQYVDTPLANFNPAAAAPLPAPAANAVLVVCNRATIVPELSDYRVLTEMHLPLAIKDGKRTLFLGAANGKLQIGVQDGEVAPAEVEALRTRIDEMEDAMTKAPAAKK